MTLSRDSRSKIAVSVLTLGALGLSLLISTSAWAQVAGATLSGAVTDPSGAIIPQGQISIKNVATGISTTAVANADGLYTAPNLLPGTYEITASAPGFATEVREGITLTVGAQQVLNLTLKVGQVTEKVQVTGAAPVVELASSTISAVVGSRTVVELPLNGRDWTQLAALEPSVNVVVTQQPVSAVINRGTRGYGTQMSISGTRPQLNNYRLDGISIVDYAGGAPGSVLGVALGVDAVAEFSVLTSNYSAEYGRTSGGVINAITKSGTNQIHGDAYWFLRDEALDAADFFDNFAGLQKASFHRNQFGGSVGGPIQKDKWFFFGDYEGFRQGLGTTTVDTVFSADARNGIIHNADGTTCTIGVVTAGCSLKNSAGTIGVDPLVVPYLPLYPLPNAGLIAPGNTGFFDTALNSIASDNFETFRIDRKIGGKDSVSGTWFFDSAKITLPDPLDDVLTGNVSARTMVRLEETHTFTPSLVNTLRAGFNRVLVFNQANLSVINPVVNSLRGPLNPYPGLGAAIITSVPGITDFVGGGIGSFTGDIIPWNSWQLYDDAFLAKGVHSLKFGFAFERMELNTIQPSRPTGSFNYGTLTDFLTNNPLQFTGQDPRTVSPRGIRQTLLGGYLQDDWRFRPNLTLNLGLRYEMVTVPTEVQNKLTTLPTFTSPIYRLGSPLFQNPSLRDFEPRVGFAWDPFHNGKTAVHGAFGIFDALPLNYEFQNAEATSAPFSIQQTTLNLAPGTFPQLAATAAANVPLTQLQVNSIEQHPHRNYVMIWNVNVQQQLNQSTSVTVGYVGNHGVHMVNRADDVNIVIPKATPQGYLWPINGTVMNPNVGDIRGFWWGGTSLYDALEAQVLKRMGHGFQAEGSYTWSKNIDSGSASLIGDPFENSISSPLWWGCNSCRRGLTDFSIGQTLSINYIWDIPTATRWGSIGSHLFGGWELGGIVSAETGVPITPILAGDPLGLGSHDPFDYPDRLTGPGCANPVNPGNPNQYIKLNCFAVPMATPDIAAQCAPFSTVTGSCSNLMGNGGRNTVIGPGLVNWDSSLIKNTYIRRISESFNVQFRAELFNMLNRANFETPFHNSKLFDQTGAPIGGAGAVDSTSTPAREIQFALKLIW